METWKDIADYEGIYQVSSLGRIRSITRTVIGTRLGKSCSITIKGTLLHPVISSVNRLKRRIVVLQKERTVKTFVVSTLVANAFLKYKPKHATVWFFDDNPLNCAADNLYWIDLDQCKKKNIFVTMNKLVPFKDSMTGKIYRTVSSCCRDTNLILDRIYDSLISGGRFITLNEQYLNKLLTFEKEMLQCRRTNFMNKYNRKGELIMQMEVVKWMDYGQAAVVSNGWVDKKDLPMAMSGTEYITCGILLQETEKTITLASSLKGDEVLNPVMIFKSSIMERQQFTVLQNMMSEEVMDNFMNNFISDYKNNMTKKNLSNKYNLAMSEVKSYIEKYADMGLIEKRTANWMKKTEMDREQFKNDCMHLSTDAVVKKYNLKSKQPIYDARYAMKHSKKVVKVNKYSNRNKVQFLLDNKDTMLKMFKTKNRVQIAKHFGVCNSTVTKALSMLGVEKTNRGRKALTV